MWGDPFQSMIFQQFQIIQRNQIGLCFKKREMHFAVHALLGELGQMAEVVGFGVFDDDQCAGLHHLAVQDEFGQLWQLGQVIGWIGEDQVEFARAGTDELENVPLNLYKILFFEQFFHLTDEVVLRRCLFHAGDAGATS